MWDFDWLWEIYDEYTFYRYRLQHGIDIPPLAMLRVIQGSHVFIRY